MQAMKVNGMGRITRRGVLGGSLAAGAALALPRLVIASPVIRAWPAGKVTPALCLSDLGGKVWELSALKGQPVLLNFWATWCEPCRAEMPSLELLAARHKRAALAVLSINYKEPAAVIGKFLDALPITLPILLDADGEATATWTPRVFPTTVLVDRSGRPRHSVIGELDWTGGVARELVEALLSRPKPA